MIILRKWHHNCLEELVIMFRKSEDTSGQNLPNPQVFSIHPQVGDDLQWTRVVTDAYENKVFYNNQKFSIGSVAVDLGNCRGTVHYILRKNCLHPFWMILMQKILSLLWKMILLLYQDALDLHKDPYIIHCVLWCDKSIIFKNDNCQHMHY